MQHYKDKIRILEVALLKASVCIAEEFGCSNTEAPDICKKCQKGIRNQEAYCVYRDYIRDAKADIAEDEKDV